MHMFDPGVKRQTMCPPQDASFLVCWSLVLEVFASSGECGRKVFETTNVLFDLHVSLVS